jgi:phosphate-selective porin OprO/OprP
MFRPLLLSFALVATAGPALAQDLSVRLGDRITFEPYVLLQLDEAGFWQGERGGQAAGFNARRLRLGGRLEVADQVELGFIWDFGHGPGEVQRLFEAKASYIGLRPFRITAGAFKTNFSLESMQSAGEYLFLERASIVTVTRNLAAGIARTGVEIASEGERYNLSFALTGGQAGPGRDGNQRALVYRFAGLPLRTDDLTLHLGLSGQWIFRTARDGTAPRALALSDSTELQVDDVSPSLSTPDILAKRAGVVGAEAGLALQRLWLQGEYYRILVDRQPTDNGRLDFDGWYAQAAYTVLGTPRRWQKSGGTWGAPKPTEPLNFASNNFGAVEIGARYSTVNLNDREVSGGRQQVVSLGLNWWPVEAVRLTLMYEHAHITGGNAPRRLDAVGGRVQLQF